MTARFAPLFLALLLACAPAATPPDIVLFVTDDQSPIAGCYGSPVIRTPHLDALAAEGTRFTRAHATTASCSSSRSVILTGLHHHANGQYGLAHDFHKFETFRNCAALSLPLQLKSLGYRTAHIGKLHVAPEAVYRFDRHLPTPGGPHQSPKWVEACRPLLEEKSDAPLFLCFWTIDPHRSGDVEEGAPETWKPNRFGNPPAGTTYPGIPEAPYDPASLPVPAFLPDTPECRRELAQYYQSVTRTDLALGRLVALLKETGRYDRTLIVFTSDHGMAFPGAKTTVYEAGLHVPLVVRAPGRGAAVNDALVSHADLTPTLLDAAGGYDAESSAPKKLLPTPKPGKAENPGPAFTRYHGRSWLGLLGRGDSAGFDESMGSHTFHELQMYYPMRSLRTRRFKLIWNLAAGLTFPSAADLWAASTWQAQLARGEDAPYGHRSVGSYLHRPPFELYDLVADPDERRNLAADPAHADTLADMRDRLKTLQQQTGDPWIRKWRHE
jgi:N-sulfoglucosamine sulfohydrolase